MSTHECPFLCSTPVIGPEVGMQKRASALFQPGVMFLEVTLVRFVTTSMVNMISAGFQDIVSGGSMIL